MNRRKWHDIIILAVKKFNEENFETITSSQEATKSGGTEEGVQPQAYKKGDEKTSAAG